MARFEKHRILITGAGAGIGALMAEEFAKQGAEVIVTARRISAAREVTDRIKAAGGKAHPYVLDVSKIASIAKFRDKLHQEVGPITSLINNAGVVFGGEFETVELEQHLNTFRVNTEGLMATTHAFLEDLIQADEAFLVAVEHCAPFLEEAHFLGGVLRVELGHPPLVEKFPTAHGVAEVHLPVVPRI